MSAKTMFLGAGAFLPWNWWVVTGLDFCEERLCYRAFGHEGRHATIQATGEVIRVWGEDVHAETRAKGRA